jgi:hypothetical protein
MIHFLFGLHQFRAIKHTSTTILYGTELSPPMPVQSSGYSIKTAVNCWLTKMLRANRYNLWLAVKSINHRNP